MKPQAIIDVLMKSTVIITNILTSERRQANKISKELNK